MLKHKKSVSSIADTVVLEKAGKQMWQIMHAELL
jgi:hypothetical protein